MHKFFWPQRLKTETSPLVRLGRVGHWTFVGFAILWAAILVLMTAEDGYEPGATGILLSIVAACLLVGRAIRYVLAGE